jgi:hypothetical protein
MQSFDDPWKDWTAGAKNVCANTHDGDNLHPQQKRRSCTRRKELKQQ